MAWVTGTASDYKDLLNKLVTFLTTDSTLVGLGQQWTALRSPVDLLFNATIPSGRIAFSTSGNTGTMPDTWPTGMASTNVRAKITGSIIAPALGSYAFSVLADDMVEIRIDGTLVYSQYAPSGYNTTYPSTSFTTTLSAGSHTIDVRYIGLTGTYNFLSLGWKKPGDSAFEIIPAANFSGLAATWAPVYGSGVGGGPAFAGMMTDVEMVLRGPGLAGADEVYVALNTVTNVDSDYYNIVINGTTGYLPSGSVYNQPGISPARVAMLCWNQPMKYWFIASGRRFIVVTKVSTVYEAMYGGFLLPYGLPTEMPYPLVAAASAALSNIRWSDQSANHGAFWRPGVSSSTTLSNFGYRTTAGQWEYFANYADGSMPNPKVYPTNAGTPTNFRTDPTGSYALQPIVPYRPGATPDVHGELDGVFHVPGFSNASENIITISGVDYLVVQAGFRTTYADYAAIRLS